MKAEYFFGFVLKMVLSSVNDSKGNEDVLRGILRIMWLMESLLIDRWRHGLPFLFYFK